MFIYFVIFLHLYIYIYMYTHIWWRVDILISSEVRWREVRARGRRGRGRVRISDAHWKPQG